MRSLPAAVVTEMAKEAHFQRHLFKLVATATYYWTDCDQRVYFPDHYWEPSGITYSSLSYAIDQAMVSGTLTIPNVDKVFSDITLGEDLRNKAFTIYRAWLDNSLGVIGCATEADLSIVFDGLVDALPASHRKSAQINVVSYGIGGTIMSPRRTFEPKCPWITIGGFKGTYCAYAGAETWCDGSKARCTALLNQAQFGGFEYTSELENQEVYWGRRTKSWGK